MPQRSGQRLQREELLERRAIGPARRVLVVEDDRETARIIQQHLEQLGHDVVVADTAEMAIEEAGSSACDVVVIDVQLGGDIAGDDIARTIHETLATPIVLVLKPVDAGEIAVAVEHALMT